MSSGGVRILCLAIVMTCLTDVTIGQLADNLMVSGSDRPMAYGVGTYGLAGAGTQGISGSPNGGGLYSQKIPTVTISKRVPGVIVSDGAGHAQVFQNNLDAFRDLTGILGNGISQQVESHFQQQIGGPQTGAQSFAVVQSPQTAIAPNGAAMYGDELPASGPAMQAGRRLQQGAILQNIGTQALSAIQTGAVAETSSLKADVLRALQPGDLPTITSTQDGTVQLLTNNNSGDEMQLRKDGTFTFVNGGDSPGIFSVGPKGVHFEKDNVFKSRMYMARAPTGDASNAITIGNTNDNGGQSSSTSGAAAAGAAGSTSGGGQSGNSYGVQNGNSYTSGSQASTYSSTVSGQGVPAQAPTANTEAQNTNYNAAPVPAPAPLQDSTLSTGNTQAAGSNQQDQQQNSNTAATAAYSAQYASAPQTADSAYPGAAMAPALVLDSTYSGTGVAEAPTLDSAYSSAAVAPAPVLEAQYGPKQVIQGASSFGGDKWQMADPASSAQAPAALSGSSTYTSTSSNSGAPVSSVEASASAPVYQPSYGTGSLVAQGPTASPTAAQGPSVLAVTSAYAGAVPVVQGLQPAPQKSARQLPTAADVFNIGEGIASLLGRRLMSQRQ